MKCVGLDIGGANIKFASTAKESDGPVEQIAFPFWKEKDRLDKVLQQLAAHVAPNDLVGVTMTAELADCFRDKKSGVNFVVQAVESVFEHHAPLYYQTNGQMCNAATAVKDWHLVAAANWHATGWLAFNDAKRKSGYVFDIGSTTTDIIPVLDGQPVINEQDDLARLANGQLYYGGIGRTPLCGLLDQVPFKSGTVSTANELFATTRDVFVWRNELPEAQNDFNSADGRSNSRTNAGRRLARMVCSDLNDIDVSLVDAIALQARNNLVAGITRSLTQVVDAHTNIPLCFVTFGEGAWLAKEIVAETFPAKLENQFTPTIRSFSEQVLVNQTAVALAVAKKRQQVFNQSISNDQ